MEIVIKKLEKVDEPQYQELVKMLWNDILDEELQSIMLDSYQNKNIIYVAKHEDEIVGFLNTSVRHDYVEGSTNNKTGYIEGIFVKKTFRLNHIAKDLINYAINKFNNKGILEIGSDVEIDNVESMAFHEKIGFKDVGIIKHFICTKE